MSTDQILLLMVGATTMIVTIMKTWQTGRKVDAQGERLAETAKTVEQIHVLTNSGSEQLKAVNRVLTEKLEVQASSQLSTATSALALAAARIAQLEADIVRRADASTPGRQEPRRETERPPFTGPNVRQQLDTIEQGVETIEAAVVPPKA